MSLLLLGACTPTPQSPDPDPLNGTPVKTEVGKPAGPLATKTVGPAGGTLASADGKLTLTVPAGALSAETSLTVEPVENTAPNGVGKGYHFGPEGTRFAKPATWTYHYDRGEVNGIGEVAIAVQQPDRSWVLTRGATLNTTSRTITTQIRHFSWWSVITQFRLTPETDTMLVNSKRMFEVQFIDYKGGFPRFEANAEDLLAPLVRIESVDPSRIKSVSLNGRKSGGDAGSVKVWPGVGRAQIEYSAPDEQPEQNPVALSVELQLPGKGQFMLVSNIFIKPPITFQVEGREFKKMYGVASIINSPLVGRWLQVVIQEQDSPPGRNHGLNINLKNPTVGGFDFGTFVEKVVITNIDPKNNLLEGSVSGSLVYHNQPTHYSPRIHDIARFSATFSIPLSVTD